MPKQRAWPAMGPGQSSEAGTSPARPAFAERGIAAVGAAASRRGLKLAVGAATAGLLAWGGGTRKQHWVAQ